MEKLYSINQIADQLNISQTTARRYTDTFTTYLNGVKMGRVIKYPGEAITIIETIYNLYQQGKTREEIETALSKEYKQIIEYTTHPTGTPAQRSQDIQALERLMIRNNDIMERLIETLERQQEQQAEIDELKKQLQDLKIKTEKKNKNIFVKILEEIKKIKK